MKSNLSLLDQGRFLTTQVSILRREPKSFSSREVSNAVKRLASIEVYRKLFEKAYDSLPHKELKITTGMNEIADTSQLAVSVAVVFIYRAAIYAWPAAEEKFTGALHLFLGLEREEEPPFNPKIYYEKYFERLEELKIQAVIIVDPMLASAGSFICAIKKVWEKGGGFLQHIICLDVGASPEGLERINRELPDIKVVSAAVDRGLTAKAYITGPGFGDLGQMLTGTYPVED